MESKIYPPKISARHQELADRLKGSLSYKEHYAYLLDWYANDKNGWRHQAEPCKPADSTRGIIIADGHVKASLNDVLDSLKHLEGKVNEIHAKKKRRASVTRASRAKVSYNRQATDRTQGNIFTRLVDGRRFERLKLSR